MEESLQKVAHRGRLTWICYLCYFFTGSLVTVTGMVLGPIADYYGVKPGNIDYIFTVQNGAMAVIILMGGMLMKKVRLKKLFLLAIVTEFVGMALMQSFITMPWSFVLFMGVIGFSGGMFMALASFLIVRIHPDPQERSTRLVMADFFFSFSGVVVPYVAGVLLGQNVFWIVIYYLISMVGVAMLFMVVISRFPNVVGEAQDNASLYKEKWGLSIFLVAASCYFFIMGELVFSQWLPEYLEKYINLSVETAGTYTSLFWMAMAVGLFVGRFVIKKFHLGSFIIGCYALATLFLTLTTLIPNAAVIAVCIVLCGLFNSVVYASMIAYASLQVKHTPPTLISFILAIGTLGTMSSSPVSGFIANTVSIQAAFTSCFILYIIGFVLFVIARIFSKAEKIHGPLKGNPAE